MQNADDLINAFSVHGDTGIALDLDLLYNSLFRGIKGQSNNGAARSHYVCGGQPFQLKHIFDVFNIILIQRYNRPRLIRLYRKLQAREEKKEGAICVC